MEIIKIKTYTGCTDDYFENIVRYPSNEDSVAVRGYGVDCSDPANAKRQFEAVAKHYGKSLLILDLYSHLKPRLSVLPKSSYYGISLSAFRSNQQHRASDSR